MAKQQAFGEQAKKIKAAQRKMAKVIIATKNERGKFAYKETMVDQEDAREFIKKQKS